MPSDRGSGREDPQRTLPDSGPDDLPTSRPSAPPDVLYGPLFGDPQVDAIFSDAALVKRMLDVEAALADAQAATGAIPREAASRIRDAANGPPFERRTLADEAALSGNLAIPLVRELTRRVAAIDPQAARYVHWGATSQDIIDTAAMLQCREALHTVLRHVDRASAAAAGHARRYAGTPMAGRTWLQQATPITFGLKAAGWLDALQRQRTALDAARETCCVLQFGGATGTLASLGEGALPIAEALGARLQLPVPDLPWHGHRDRVAALACALGVMTGAMGKIARDLSLLAQTEVGEAMESPARGRGGSSTMPHKRNPVSASVALAAAVRTPGLVATLLTAMPQEHERGLGGWQAEWLALPEIVRVAAGGARATADALEGLVVDEGRMRRNLEITGGLTLAEAISMALAEQVGKPEAHALVEEASRRAVDAGRPLADTLSEDAAVTKWLSPAHICERLTPEGYLGAARAFVNRVLGQYESRR
jgi:3-carboxy-cis,cis-muconate cycloisomerase